MNRLCHPVLMRESERRIEVAASSTDPGQQLVARRILTEPVTQRRWESEHSRYMRAVVDPWRRPRQIAALHSVALGLIHRKALFEYLRDAAVRGEERRRVIRLFHGSRAYSEAVIAEHGMFVRSSVSHLCTTHIGRTIFGDPACDEPLNEYELIYSEYFRLFCHARSRQPGTECPERTLLPYLKRRVREQHATLLALGR